MAVWRNLHAPSSSTLKMQGDALMTQLTTEFRAEFDQATKILLMRVVGLLTDKSLADLYEASRELSASTNARVGIVDLSLVAEFTVTTEFIRHRARQERARYDPRIIVAPQAYAFGLFRMLQLLGEASHPQLQVVHAMDEVFAALGIPSAHFKPLLVPAPFRAEYATQIAYKGRETSPLIVKRRSNELPGIG
jgi:hypothetical protein